MSPSNFGAFSYIFHNNPKIFNLSTDITYERLVIALFRCVITHKQAAIKLDIIKNWIFCRNLLNFFFSYCHEHKSDCNKQQQHCLTQFYAKRHEIHVNQEKGTTKKEKIPDMLLTNVWIKDLCYIFRFQFVLISFNPV